jgi:ATP-dependent DNA helicase DinG
MAREGARHVTMHPAPLSAPPAARLEAHPVLIEAKGAGLLGWRGEVRRLAAGRALEDALERLAPPLVLHAPATFRRLGLRPRPALDLLELYLLARPAQPLVPSLSGLAAALGEALPEAAGARLAFLRAAAGRLLADVEAARASLPEMMESLLDHLAAASWPWMKVLAGGAPEAPAGGEPRAVAPLAPWHRLPEWEERGGREPPTAFAVSEAEARRRLAEILGAGAEIRPGQADYAAAASHVFAPRAAPGEPRVVLAEAGTGTGKTLGYIAPASVWAERNGGTVWISTYTRHLQRQIETEMARLYPDPAVRRMRVVVRKGRENYLCLLNLQEALYRAGASARERIGLALIARWVLATSDGDLFGGDLPGFVAELFGTGLLAGLADRRGECIHAACPHWRRCFIEHNLRRVEGADFVIANHALVMAQAAHVRNWGEDEEGGQDAPTHYVFDEGHHLFDAADGAFALSLSARAALELRRFLFGSEGGSSRARGLRARLLDLIALDAKLTDRLEDVLALARLLPGPEIFDELAAGPEASGLLGASLESRPFTHLLILFDRQVRAREKGAARGLDADLEADLFPLDPEIPPVAARLAERLAGFELALKNLIAELGTHLAEAELDAAARNRLAAARRTLTRRALEQVIAWRDMLGLLERGEEDETVPPRFIHFLRRQRLRDGFDVGLYRHWLDPTEPFAATLLRPAHGALITSASLRDLGAGTVEAAWQAAERLTGGHHLPDPPGRVIVPSPFDYAAQTRVFIVSDLPIDDLDALAGAFGALFEAAGGGALGLFTAIDRLRRVHARLAPRLAERGLPLYAQHVDPLQNTTLVDIFRAEEESCLLGTDAMRDGVDVPGRALRLVVFERVPWPRRDILHRERRKFLGAGDPDRYDDLIIRSRLRQAFGRLVRAKSDRGVFVLLDRRMPSRFFSAFPTGVPIARLPFDAVLAATRAFLAPEREAAGRPGGNDLEGGDPGDGDRGDAVRDAIL